MTLTLTNYTLCVGILTANLVMLAFFLLVVREGRNQVANQLLSLFCFVLALVYTSDLLAANGVFTHYPLLIGGELLLLYTLGPLYYLYAQAMTRLQFRFRPKQLLHLLPMAGFALWLVSFKQQDLPIQLAQYHAWESGQEPAPFVVAYGPKLVLLGYLVAIFQRLTHHQRAIREVLAEVEQKDLHWLKRSLLMLLGLYAGWVLVNENLLPALYFGVATLGYSYWLGYYIIRQKAIYTHVAPTVSLDTLNQQSSVRYRNSTLTEADKNAWIDRVNTCMETQKPFLDKELTLTTLADQLRLSPNQLSQVLNEGFGENFYAFINRYRVAESKRLLLDPSLDHFTILGVAFEAGFNTKSTFNKAFRELVGQSPSDYQKTHKRQSQRSENRSV